MHAGNTSMDFSTARAPFTHTVNGALPPKGSCKRGFSHMKGRKAFRSLIRGESALGKEAKPAAV